MSFWDTSCLVKLYTPEPDSQLLRNRLAKGGTCVASDIALLEFWATVRRKESEGILAPGEAAKVQAVLDADVAANRITIVPTDSAV